MDCSPTIQRMVAWRKVFDAFARCAGPVVVCVVVPTLLVASTIDRHPKFSPIDEAAHFDYVERVYSHGYPPLATNSCDPPFARWLVGELASKALSCPVVMQKS